MRTALFAAAATVLLAPFALALDKPLNIEVTSEAKCTRKSQRGDKVDVHYRGTLESDGTCINSHLHPQVSPHQSEGHTNLRMFYRTLEYLKPFLVISESVNISQDPIPRPKIYALISTTLCSLTKPQSHSY